MPGIEQLEHVLITLWMTRARRIRVRELIDNRESGMPGQDGVEIHFVERGAAIFDLRARHDRHPFEQRFRLLAPVRFDDADHDFAALLLLLPRRLQHRVGLAHAGRHPEKNLELAARSGGLFALHLREDVIRIRPFRLAHFHIVRLNLTKLQT